MKPETKVIRVVVADDSPTARELLVALYESAGDMKVVGVGKTGADAVRLVKRHHPDVVSMDVIMPVMDGLEATRQIMREAPTPIVIVTASLISKERDLTFEALRAGALTSVRKPGLDDPETCAKLVQTVRLMAKVSVVRRWTAGERKLSEPLVLPSFGEEIADHRKIDVIGIAASTGGPGALATVLKPLPADFPIPIVIVQHVTSGFAAGLAEWLNSQISLSVSLAGHGDRPRAGQVLLPPDDYHIQFNKHGLVELYKGQPYKGLRPSANYLFHSLARVYGARAVGVILTGMGDDGVDGIEALHGAGGLTLAQDEQSCVVFGMPREAIVRRAIDRVLGLGQIATVLNALAQRK
jgi:two-component system chemotaxis response regulator CheB